MSYMISFLFLLLLLFLFVDYTGSSEVNSSKHISLQSSIEEKGKVRTRLRKY